ncbi:MAG: hypothetical protein NZ473_01055 [Candidatus Kapabacteria bacterium]|nr:hypothetical protein [Candidatus Kapabacteria bacterium]MCS7169512.1 hypothetical protein [Candidatus Kapabacteria bacterium]MDW7997456.1 hypothetical protein [Bacteroidota bacterium]MDW8224571.1 hypothetical protein [Bacteroidota bacterium]
MHPIDAEKLVAQIQWELQIGSQAWQEGNEGKARVCARRAVAWLVQALPHWGFTSYGSHVGENLRRLSGDESLPESVRLAAQRLQGGARAQLHGGLYSLYPLHDAGLILRHFARQLGIEQAIMMMLQEFDLCNSSSDTLP